VPVPLGQDVNVDLRAEAKQRIERIARERRANSEKIARILKRVGVQHC
jgi:hypothetical protein